MDDMSKRRMPERPRGCRSMKSATGASCRDEITFNPLNGDKLFLYTTLFLSWEIQNHKNDTFVNSQRSTRPSVGRVICVDGGLQPRYIPGKGQSRPRGLPR